MTQWSIIMLRPLLIAVVISLALTANAGASERRTLAGYYPSWLPADAEQLDQTPDAYTHVILAFAKPDFSWNGKDWSGTGLDFAVPPGDIRRRIARLQARGVRVLLAVGGATYLNWTPLAAEAQKAGTITAALAQFANDMGLDGLDVDYETKGAGPDAIAEYQNAIRALSQAAGPNRLLALAAWSTGADCTKATGVSACGVLSASYDSHAGRERLVFRDQSLYARIHMISIMTYDAGTEHFDPVKAWSLYRAMVPPPIVVNIGFQTAPESWGTGTLVATDANAMCSGAIVKADQFGNRVNKPYSVERSLREGPLAASANGNPRDGAMLWHIVKHENLPVCGPAKTASPRGVERTARDLFDQPSGP